MNKFLQKLAKLFLGISMAAGVGVAIGSNQKASSVSAAEGDQLKLYNTNSSTFTTGYKRQSGDNFVWWGQKGYFGANNATNHGKCLPTAADLPVVKAQNSSATTSTTGLYYLYSSEAVANVGSVQVYLSAKSGSSTVNAYVVSSSTAASSGSATWSKVTLASTSTSAQGANVASASTYTFTFNATETSAKYYGVVFATSSYWRATNLTFKLREGDVKYTVTYNANGGTVSPTSEQVSKNGHPTFPTPSYTGYTFDGWQVNGTGTYYTSANASSYTVISAVTFVAHWTSASAESITVTGSSSLYVGDSDITLTATPENFSPATYTWNSSNTGVATISGSGTTATLHAVSKGTTVITASASGTGGTVTSNEFTVTIKRFSIALSSSEVSMKASKSTTVTVTPTDANGTVVVTAESNNTSVATTSVSGTTITITSGSEGGCSTTITVAAKDNNGASGYHTAVNQTINLEVTAGYVVGDKITALPSSDKYVFLGNDAKTSWVGGSGSSAPETTNDSEAALFIFSTTGTLRYYDEDTQQAGKYIYNGGSNTTVSLSTTSAAWSNGLGNSDYPGLLQLSGGRFLLFNGNVAKAYATANLTEANAPYFIYAYEAVASTPTAALNNNSVSGLKGNSDSSLTLTISHFTATGLNITYQDDGESSFSSSSSVASVSCGYATGSNTVSVSFTGVGTTTVKLSVTRGTGNPLECTFTVTVAAKPDLLRVVQNRDANPLVDITSVEIENGGSAKQFNKTNIYVEDTDHNPIEIGTISDYVTLSKLSGDDCISISGGSITGTAVGTAVVKFALKSLTTVYDTVTVTVADNYKTTVNTITVINDVAVDQGNTLVVSDHISAKTANSHFGSTLTIADDELLFSWTNDRSAGVIYSSFVFDVTDSTLQPHETQTRTIYVFTTFDSSYAGTSFTAVIEVEDRSVTGLLVDGVAKSNGDTVALSVPRNSSYNLNEHVTVNPVNATESHEVVYTLASGSTYVSLSNGVIAIGSKTGSGVASITAKPYAKQDFSITFSVTITREAMTITADAPETWSVASSLSVGDRVAIVYESATVLKQLSEVSSNIGQAEDYTTAGEPSSSYIYTVGAGSVTDSYTFAKDGAYLAYTNLTTSKNNNLYTVSDLEATNAHDQASWTIDFSDFTITNVYNTNRILQYNAQSPRFCGYVSGQEAPTIYKLTGGTGEVTVTDALFNVVNGAMSLKSGSTTLYDLGLCNASGTSFDVSAWNTLGSSFTSSIISDNKLAYARANANGNEIEQFLAVYDYVIGKKVSGYSAYASADDYLGRVASGKISASPMVNPLINIVGEKANSVAIIVIISMVSVTAIGGYFFLRKRKENI